MEGIPEDIGVLMAILCIQMTFHSGVGVSMQLDVVAPTEVIADWEVVVHLEVIVEVVAQWEVAVVQREEVAVNLKVIGLC